MVRVAEKHLLILYEANLSSSKKYVKYKQSTLVSPALHTGTSPTHTLTVKRLCRAAMLLLVEAGSGESLAVELVVATFPTLPGA